MIVEFDRRRRFIVERLNAMDGITCSLPQGAFYVFPNLPGLYGRKWGEKKISNSADVTDFLLEEARVAVVAGSGFGDDKYIRFSYATSMENIKKGMDRIQEALKCYKNSNIRVSCFFFLPSPHLPIAPSPFRRFPVSSLSLR